MSTLEGLEVESPSRKSDQADYFFKPFAVPSCVPSCFDWMARCISNFLSSRERFIELDLQ